MEETIYKNGESFIQGICDRLSEKGVLLYDANIVKELRKLTMQEMGKIVLESEKE